MKNLPNNGKTKPYIVIPLGRYGGEEKGKRVIGCKKTERNILGW